MNIITLLVSSVVPGMLQIHEQYAIMLTASEVSIEIHYEVQQKTPGCVVCGEIEMHHLLTIANKMLINGTVELYSNLSH